MSKLAKRIRLEAKAFNHTPGRVWEASFDYPGPEFMKDFVWDVYDTNNGQPRLPLVAYAMFVDPKGQLSIRFDDKSKPPLLPNSEITVALLHPAVRGKG